MTHRWIIRAHVHVQLVSNQINSSKGTSLAALRNTLDRAQRRRENTGGGEGAADTPPIEMVLCVLFAGAIDRLLFAASLPPIAVGS